jgi:hypothetical protein
MTKTTPFDAKGNLFAAVRGEPIPVPVMLVLGDDIEVASC